MIVATGVFMSTLDSSMVNIALPTIMKEFHSRMAATEWVVLIYLLTITSTLLFWGHLGDRFGRGRIYGGGMLIFAVGSLTCAVSPTLSILILSRFGQALGAAMLMSTGPAIVKESFPHEQLGRAMGMIGVAVALGLMSGPSLGGFLIEYFSWRSLFYLTVPFGLVFSLLALKFIPMAKPASDGAIDWPGAVTWAATLLLFTIILTHLSKPLWSAPVVLGLGLAGTGLASLFIIREKSTPHPILPLDLFHSRYFSLGIISAVLSFTALFAAILLTPFYLDRLRMLPPSKTGLIMAAIPAAIMLVSPLAGWLADHFEKRAVATVGLVASSSGVLLLSMSGAESPIFSIGLCLALIGGGQALFLSPNNSAVLGTTQNRRAGSAAALLATSRNLGMLLGIAMATLLFTIIFSARTGGLDMRDFHPEKSGPFIAAFKGALQGAALLGFTGAVASWWRGKSTAKKT